jgi:hypothetical protein
VTDAKRKPEAVEAEATPDSTLSFKWDGHDYEVPGSLDDCDIEVIEAFEEGKAIGAVSGVLGSAQWRQLKARSKPKVRDATALMEIIAELYGFSGSGE